MFEMRTTKTQETERQKKKKKTVLEQTWRVFIFKKMIIILGKDMAEEIPKYCLWE